ncbi:BON domain-containing protein [Cognatiluteimonas lumbrici]|uniref:BON domain-containing protein n=1 Tax=Cognatiluteimonas lumbrici TaxID=2559601 RepID=UPI0015E38BB9|nr:BON domain-containing protein [Luteimonas lumbrici]
MRNNRDENLASTTVADMKAVAQDMLRMGKHWTQAAQDWLDQRRDDMRDDRRQRRTRRGTRDFQSDYGGGGYDQVDDSPVSRPYGNYGARGYRGVGPRNYRRSDERIREDLNDRLTEADDLDASDISVEVSNGVATLTGSVGHRWMKHRAEDLADECLGVRDVRNHIQVRDARRSNAPSAGGVHASGSARVGSAEVSGSLHTNTGNSAGGTSPGGQAGGGATSTGTGTNTHQDTATGRPGTTP